MTIILSSIICILTVSLIAKLVVGQIDRANPSVEDEAELEAIFVHCIAVEFSRGKK